MIFLAMETGLKLWMSSVCGPVTRMYFLLSVFPSCCYYSTITIYLTLQIRYGLDQKELGVTHLNLSRNLIGGTPYQSGALFSFPDDTQTVTFRVGVSFVSAEQACANAESEVGDASFEDIVARSKVLWQDKLNRIEIDVPNTPANVTEMLYTSLYRSFLTPVRINIIVTCEGSGK